MHFRIARKQLLAALLDQLGGTSIDLFTRALRQTDSRLVPQSFQFVKESGPCDDRGGGTSYRHR